MRAGSLRHRISLEKRGTAGAAWGSSDTWTTYATVWAAVEPIRGREYFAAEKMQSEVTHRIRLRYIEGVNASMRVSFGGRIFRIESVQNADERNRMIEIMAIEDIDA